MTKTRNEQRLILDMRKFGINIFDEFGRYNYVNTQEILPKHIHTDMIEICYLAKGRQQYIVGGESYQLCGGDIFITFPNELHGSGEMPEEKGVLYWLVLKAPTENEDFLGLNYDDACKIYERLLRIRPRLYKAGVDCERVLQQIIQFYFDSNDPLAGIGLRNQLVFLLVNIIRESEAQCNRNYSDKIISVINYIENNLFDVFDLEELAGKANLSLSRFKHRFKEEMGIPPLEYILRKKIKKAEQLLNEDNASIKEIAYDLGFSSPAYFSTVFKQYSGISPTSFKRNPTT